METTIFAKGFDGKEQRGMEYKNTGAGELYCLIERVHLIISLRID